MPGRRVELSQGSTVSKLYYSNSCSSNTSSGSSSSSRLFIDLAINDVALCVCNLAGNELVFIGLMILPAPNVQFSVP